MGYQITRNEARQSGKVEFSTDPPLIKPLMCGYKRFLVDKMPAKSGKAVLAVLKGKEYWLPKSQVNVGIEIRETKKVQVIDIPDWLARKRNLA